MLLQSSITLKSGESGRDGAGELRLEEFDLGPQHEVAQGLAVRLEEGVELSDRMELLDAVFFEALLVSWAAVASGSAAAERPCRGSL